MRANKLISFITLALVVISGCAVLSGAFHHVFTLAVAVAIYKLHQIELNKVTKNQKPI